jgi:hypothetical protein
MIIYGYKEKPFVALESTQVKCGNCDTDKQFVYLFCRYVHIYWIPFFPIKKVARIQCQHCKIVKEEKEMSLQELELINNLKRDHKLPKKYFAGLIIILGLFIVPMLLSIVQEIVAVLK